MDKAACIIAAGVWGGKRALLKNRDRGYTPQITLVHELIDGVEVVYMRDELTGWCEGMNEHGIGVVNSALAVKEDELRPNEIPERKQQDGEKVLKALAQVTLDDAVKSLCEYLDGLEGHTFVADPKGAASVEYVIDHDCVVKYLDPGDLHVRTNHGRDTGRTGYRDPDDYISSTVRKERAYQSLRMTTSVREVAADLARANSDDRNDPNNPVRDTRRFSTNSQMVMNLTDREVLFYVIPGKMDYEGVENNLPDGYSPKIKLRVFSYRNGGKEIVELSPKTGLRRKSVDPVKLAARYLQAEVPEKYKHIDFKPPQSVANAAEKGLEYRQKASPSNRGGLTPAEAAKQGIGSGVQRAVNLKNRDNISPDTIKQMTAFFSRHEKNKGVAPEHKGEPWNDKGNVAWLIWGGDAGRAWAEKVKKQMEAADEKSSKKAAEQEMRDLTPVTEYQSPVQLIEAELMVLESLWSDVQAVLDTYSSVVPMPHVGRIAAADLALHSQTEVFVKCEHAMRHAERVINMCRTQLLLDPGNTDVSSFLRDAQMLYDRFASARASARELLSAMNQKILPSALKGIVAEAVDAVKAVTRFPNSVTVKVNSRMAPIPLNERVVSAQVFDAYVTVYPLPRDEAPDYQQFVFTQATLGDTAVYLTVIDRTNEESPTKPVKVTDGASAAKKILTALRGWSGLF